jgi:hypothetical protein
MLEWLAENYKVMRIAELHEKFNQRFGKNATRTALASYLARNKIQSGRLWSVPRSARAEGDERIGADGYTYRKIGKKCFEACPYL